MIRRRKQQSYPEGPSIDGRSRGRSNAPESSTKSGCWSARALSGKGTRIFEDRQDLKLVEATTFENGVALLRYEIKKSAERPHFGVRTFCVAFGPAVTVPADASAARWIRSSEPQAIHAARPTLLGTHHERGTLLVRDLGGLRLRYLDDAATR
jgi:hypothetical protein